MKTLLIMLLVSLCVLGWRSPDILQAIGMAGALQDPSTLATGQSIATQPMSAVEFADLANKDPQAYQKFFGSLRSKDERSEVDKLLNFFARGKYE